MLICVGALAETRGINDDNNRKQISGRVFTDHTPPFYFIQ
jgi:hypothetical protein